MRYEVPEIELNDDAVDHKGLLLDEAYKQALNAAEAAKELLNLFNQSPVAVGLYTQAVLAASYYNAVAEGYSLPKMWSDGEYVVRKGRIFVRVYNNGRDLGPAYQGPDMDFICADRLGLGSLD